MPAQLLLTRFLNEHFASPVTALLRDLHVQPTHPQAPITNEFAMELLVFVLLVAYFIVVRVSLDVEKPSGVQQLAAGIILAPFALAIPQHPIHWSVRGVCAIFYLITFGSIVGYSAYVYALDRLPVAIASVYPYVNSIVAVILGWLIYREPFGPREALSMVVIFSSVALVKRYSRATH